MIKWAFLMAMICILVLPGSVAAADNGEIKGKVENGTDGSIVADAQVILWKGDMGSDDWEDIGLTDTDDNGEFTFAEVPISAGQAPYLYYATTKYDGVEYGSGLTASASEDALDIIVYETTESSEHLNLNSFEIYIRMLAGEAGSDTAVILVEEIYYFENRGSTTYIGPEIDESRQTIKFPLHEGYRVSDISAYVDGVSTSSVTNTAEGFAYTIPVEPGMIQPAFSYVVESTSGSYIFSRTLPYDAQWGIVLIQQEFQGRSIDAQSSQLGQGDLIEEDGTVYLSLFAVELDADTDIEVTISGLQESGAGLADTLRKVGFAALVVAFVGFVVGYPLVKRRSKSASKLRRVSTQGAIPIKERLLHELAELDDRFQAGEISQDEYQKLRAKKKSKLSKLMGEG